MPDETELDVRRVLDVLPHRFPFVMIDRVVSIEGNESLTGLKNVSINEPFFTGHFPWTSCYAGEFYNWKLWLRLQEFFAQTRFF